jgi:hypothetical protein
VAVAAGAEEEPAAAAVEEEEEGVVVEEEEGVVVEEEEVRVGAECARCSGCCAWHRRRTVPTR